MLNNLCADILTNIFSKITAPKDFLNSSMSCKKVQTFLKYRCTHVVTRLYHNPSLDFFRHMIALQCIHVFRKYDSFLDFTPLLKLGTLNTIYVNNTANTFNIPTHPSFLFSDEKLVETTPKTYYSDPEQDDDADEEFLNAKQYFTRRYEKKYTKILYKNKNFKMKTRHIACSI